MKLQKIINRLQKLHPKEIDLSLHRIKNLCKKLGNPQDEINCIQVCGTNGKGSTISFLRSVLREANIKCNIYTSPHVQHINERFVYNDEIISDEDLADLLIKIEEINNGQSLTYFEALTSAFFYGCKKYKNNLVIAEFGLFGRGDAVNILKKNLCNIVTSCSEDHLDWLPKNERTIERIIFEKTSSLLNSNIIVAKQTSNKITECIKKNIVNNDANKYFFNEDYNFILKENDFFYYEDKYGGLKIPKPKMNGQFQLENASTAIATLRILENLKIKDQQIIDGIKKAHNTARLEEIKSGKLKDMVKNNMLILDSSHNPGGSKVLNDYLQTLECKKHVIIGMMANKDHKEYISYFKNISSLTTVDIPNQKNAMSGIELKEKFKDIPNVQYKESIEEAIKSIPLKKNDLLIITGSLYLAGEVLNLN
ncbi:MAG: bifunctional folylpolyglutamate synthase/dihydrofolate synthase [Pelagibacteraceae bacterium TMED201]|nr:bifunctional folylpolyglutamate synthase/dihydrofolate synthase [Pelagibacterales bacterium SAG-MED30]OUW63909.1 MAG: bifunctional folylpolyglutamate synthase/dihydrofolate synthase [Pelagibacteraceae bacterium TMED201]|tara:strand:- start:367 stop:1635 length:1269 start_codon:yes stop_codon:yes gene_type:complete